MAAVSPIPKIVTTPINEDFNREEEEDDDDCRDKWGEIVDGRRGSPRFKFFHWSTDRK